MRLTDSSTDQESTYQTRAQQDMILAARLVAEVSSKEVETKQIYGGLCHQFPVLVRMCGLCQAIAFSLDKSTPKNGKLTPRSMAHRLLLDHVAQLLDCKEDLLDRVRQDNATQYMLNTRRILRSWIYFKRFAVSILKVCDASAAREDTDGE
jgi:CRISPR-associated protein Cmr5